MRDRRRYRLAIFDFDGTLANSLPWFRSTFGEVAERFGLNRLSAEELEALRGCGTAEILRRLGAPIWRLPAIARHMRARKARDADQVALFAGAADLLRAVKKSGTALAIVSSDGAENIRRVLGPGPAGLFSHYACSAALFGKAARMRQVLRDAAIPAAEALAIGDELRDAEAARRAGIDFAAVSWGYARRDALAATAPRYLFDTFDELCAILMPPHGAAHPGAP